MAEVDSLGGAVSEPWTYFHDIDEEGRMMRGGVDLKGQPAWMRTGPEGQRFYLGDSSGVPATGPEMGLGLDGAIRGWAADPLNAYDDGSDFGSSGPTKRGWRPGTPEEWRETSPRYTPSLTDRQLITGDEGPPAPYQFMMGEADKHIVTGEPLDKEGLEKQSRDYPWVYPGDEPAFSQHLAADLALNKYREGERGHEVKRGHADMRRTSLLTGFGLWATPRPREDIRSKDPFYMPHPSTPDVGYGPSVSPMRPNQVKQIMAEMLRAKEEQRKQSLPR